MCTIGQVLLGAAKEEKKDSAFDVLVPEYRRSQGCRKQIKDIRALRKLVDGSNIRVRERGMRNSATYFRRQKIDVIRNNQRPVMVRRVIRK